MLVENVYFGKTIITLTLHEKLILEMLIENKGHTVKRDEIIKKLVCTKKQLINYMYRLRLKMRREFIIYSKKNIGYYIK